jgi:hypothetical protein
MKIDIFAYTKTVHEVSRTRNQVLPFLLAAVSILSLSSVAAAAETSDWGYNNGVQLCPKNTKVGVIGETNNFYINICYKGAKVIWYSGIEKANLRNRIRIPATYSSANGQVWTGRNGRTRYEVHEGENLRVYNGNRLLLQEDFIHFHIVGD